MDGPADAASEALRHVLGLCNEETVFIVTDQETMPVAEAFRDAAHMLNSRKIILYVLDENERPLFSLPEALKNRIEDIKSDPGDVIFLNLFRGILEETPFRLELLHAQKGPRSRVGHAPGITIETVTQGSMNIDYSRVKETARRLMDALQDAVWVHVTAPGGTDITLNVEGRAFETDTEIPSGSMGNLPVGEVWCAPVEDSGNGTLVVDGSIGDMGQVPAPVEITVVNGKATDVLCSDAKFRERVLRALSLDPMASVIGELGIGLNPRARLTGNLLEDEKAGGTAHIAFGNNIDMPGGKNSSKTHRDFLFYRPTIEVALKGGETRTVIKEGELADE